MPIILEETQKSIEKSLIDSGIISELDLAKIKKKSKANSVPVLQMLVDEKYIDSEELTKTIATATGIPYVNLVNARINPDVLALLPQELAENYMAVPLGEMEGRLVVAMLDASNVQAVDFLSSKIGRPIKVYMASQEGIESVLKQYHLDFSKDVEKALETGEVEETTASNTEEKNIQTLVQDSPISKALSSILEYAAKHRASDIHIEPLEKELKIRCRIDGVLKEVMKLPKSTEPALISRVKILSNLKIDEHRMPQDGQFTIKVNSKPIDMRVAISPVVWGEQCVLRLLDTNSITLKLENLGYYGRALRTIKNSLKYPNGMILTSGPTGSGKSTSMYSMIQEIKSDKINIVTLEDPVEYKIDGVNQIQVNPDVGLTFATGLRSVLRQDPDVVMVGEIRDAETASLAVQAALTGHLVLSTLHTNGASSILPRLLDMGVEPFLIASTVKTVIGQRLVRKLEKPEQYSSSKAETMAVNNAIGNFLPTNDQNVKSVSEDLGYGDLPTANQNAYTLYKGVDTPGAPSGYKGRLGIYEVFNVTDKIQEAIMKHETAANIQKIAREEGMVTMRQDGYFKALKSLTTLEEVNRVAGGEDF